MRYIKKFEYYNREDYKKDNYESSKRKIRRILIVHRGRVIEDMIESAMNGILPQEHFELSDEGFEILLNKLELKHRVLINRITSNIDKFITFYKKKNEIKDRTIGKDIVSKKDKNFIFKEIISGLKFGVSVMDTIDTLFKGITIDKILNALTDEDKRIINKYQKILSDSPENIKKYQDVKYNKYEPNVTDPDEDFISSFQYKNMLNNIRKEK